MKLHDGRILYRSVDPVDFINSLSLDHNIQQVMLSEFGVGTCLQYIYRATHHTPIVCVGCPGVSKTVSFTVGVSISEPGGYCV